MNCLKGGIFFANLLTTVSPRYAREITTELYGCGLDGALRRRQDVARRHPQRRRLRRMEDRQGTLF